MKIAEFVSASLTIMFISFASYSAASPPGKTVSWNTPAGRVVFSGSIHEGKGMRCMDCHQDSGKGKKLFEMRLNSFVTNHRELDSGKYCGYCHNGKVSFRISDKANCSRCHKKSESKTRRTILSASGFQG
ncbi:MAG: cytochrome c3 family protein [Dissulfurispiraceae bacterium]|jgi:c(7)-type cytochrome triheme protein|nr:cytochrome c3 family protein [Dissulfurispiraceae bacterium]